MKSDIGFIKRFDTAEQLATSVADKVVAILNKNISQNNYVNVALSGGATPSLYFKVLISEYANKVEWEKVNVYWADERHVPHKSSESNYGNAYNEFLSRLSFKNIFPLNTSLPCEECSVVYEKLLQKNLPTNNLGIPVFDLILLGLGNDGHVASLFPETPVLNETKKSVACVYVEKLKANRISLTFPVLNSSASRIIVFSGANKERIFNDASKDKTGNKYPVQHLFKSASETYWMFA